MSDQQEKHKLFRGSYK